MYFAAVVKSLVLIKNRVKIGQVLDKLQQKPFLPNPNRGGDNEEKILNECIWVTSVQVHNKTSKLFNSTLDYLHF